MKNVLMLLLVLPFMGCKKSESEKPETAEDNYMVIVKCDDCSFSVGESKSKFVDVKGTAYYGLKTVPSTLYVSLLLKSATGDVTIIFEGVKIKCNPLLIWQVKAFTGTADISSPLPPTRN